MAYDYDLTKSRYKSDMEEALSKRSEGGGGGGLFGMLKEKADEDNKAQADKIAAIDEKRANMSEQDRQTEDLNHSLKSGDTYGADAQVYNYKGEQIRGQKLDQNNTNDIKSKYKVKPINYGGMA